MGVCRRTSRGQFRAGWRTGAAASIAFVATLVPSGVGSAATVGDTASATVTLDGAGSLPLDAFDPALGTLTGVEVSLSVDVLVQVCVENTSAAAGSLAAGSVAGSLAAEFPGGAGAATASANAAAGATQLAASNGTADCANGYDGASGRFPGGVTAGDTVFAEGADQATSSCDADRQRGDGAVHRRRHGGVAFTPASDSDLDVPSMWDSVVVGQGQLQASVTYTYTPGGRVAVAARGRRRRGRRCPSPARRATRSRSIAVVAVLAGSTSCWPRGAGGRARRRGTSRRHGRTFGVIGLLVVTVDGVASPLARVVTRARRAGGDSTVDDDRSPHRPRRREPPTTSSVPPATSVDSTDDVDRRRSSRRRRPRRPPRRRRRPPTHVDTTFDDVDAPRPLRRRRRPRRRRPRRRRPAAR